jgi:hypothetical protein
MITIDQTIVKHGILISDLPPHLQKAVNSLGRLINMFDKTASESGRKMYLTLINESEKALIKIIDNWYDEYQSKTPELKYRIIQLEVRAFKTNN